MAGRAGADGGRAQWELVDEGWGRRAVDFATLSEPANCREYVALHQRLAVGDGDALLDVACGSGLAVELATARGAVCSGIDASPRLVAVARDRNPAADLRVGDMHALPWEDDSFDVVTSFRGIWGTTPDALAEVRRVLRPGGRLGLTVWGHLKASPGAWALRPFTLASEPKVDNQRAMVALGRPGAGEELLAAWGFHDVRRVAVPFVWEFADPESYARALASTGPAYEAIQAVGEEELTRFAVEVARERVRDGLPLRAEVDLVGYVARRPDAPSPSGASWPDAGFLAVPPTTPQTQAMYDGDVETMGFVMNVSRLWTQLPEAQDGLFALLGTAAHTAGLTFRQRAILVTACASAMRDSYCSLAWGNKLAREAGAEVAGGVLRGEDELLDDAERALARWARRVAREPNATTPADVQELRDVGYDDQQVFAVTLFLALRLAFSTVNDALGALPDRELDAEAEAPVRDAVTFGRPVGSGG
jgi:SAM-dependent methyltransferase/alkylhydroperoxidase family enzyme